MRLALPELLWLLVLPAALLVWELVRGRRRAAYGHPKILRAEAGLRSVTLSEGPERPTAGRRRYLLCAGIALGIVALARPQWGRLDEPVFDQSREIIIALDLSRSMLTPDVRPSRLERSKLLIRSLLDRLKGERVGLIVFSGTAFLQSPVSADYEILREFLPSLGPDYLPEGGTNYGQLLDTAIDAFGDAASADRYLIILSDGEATDENWREKIPELEKRGIRVIGLGVGTGSGGMIPDGSGGFMKDETGAVVLSKLESGTLRDLANQTHGAYRDASEWVDLSKVLDSTVEEGRKGRFVEQRTIRYVERYQWALALALVCLVASFWLEFPVNPKSRAIRLGAAQRTPAVPPAIAAALAAALLLAAAPRALADGGPEGGQAALLSKIVGRLSSQDKCSPQDWAELGHETATWGEQLKGGNQQVPQGPIRDALRAVDLGEHADPKAADWPRLRSELEELLKKPDENKKQDQKQKQDDKQDQNKDEKQNEKQQEQGQDQKQDQKQGSSPQNGSKDDSKGQSGQQGEQGRQPESRPPSSESAFGKIGGSPTPTPLRREPQQAMQKVGGVDRQQPPDAARNDPELAVPLEKLEQIKNQDSPAELFRLLRKGEPVPTPTNTGKNW